MVTLLSNTGNSDNDELGSEPGYPATSPEIPKHFTPESESSTICGKGLWASSEGLTLDSQCCSLMCHSISAPTLIDKKTVSKCCVQSMQECWMSS